MFAKAIELAAKFTRPIHSISRNYGSTTIQPGAATIFFVNSDGWALTCRHVAQNLAVGGELVSKADNFRKELEERRGTQKERKIIKELEKKYGYTKNTIFELRNRFVGCIQGELKLRIVMHEKYDVALIKFEDYEKLLCDTFPVFPADTSGLQPGTMLCRLGYPFPEFTNYEYNKDNDRLIWTEKGRKNTPRFPIEGMITRRILDDQGKVYAFEMSTPGLRGQSGGPAFDVETKVWGMQFATAHLDLDFDVNQEVIRGGIKKSISDSAFLHVGGCIHIDVLKSFMQENNVSFAEA